MVFAVVFVFFSNEQVNLIGSSFIFCQSPLATHSQLRTNSLVNDFEWHDKRLGVRLRSACVYVSSNDLLYMH